ncbi:hypothetical protein ABW21_db0205157 [Orbilia brochopaga]|nr:hypothetical protein ABW21_db0205157 [Drechslerella brochopaga]
MQCVTLVALVLGYYAFWVPALVQGHTLFHFLAALLTYACELVPLILPVPLIHLWVTDRPRFTVLEQKAAALLTGAVAWLGRLAAEWAESAGCPSLDGNSLTPSSAASSSSAAASAVSSVSSSPVRLDALSSHYELTPSIQGSGHINPTPTPTALSQIDTDILSYTAGTPSPAPTCKSTASAHPAECECTPCGKRALLRDSIPDTPSVGIDYRCPAEIAVGGAVRGDKNAWSIEPFPPPPKQRAAAASPLPAPRPQRWIGYKAYEAKVEQQLAAKYDAADWMATFSFQPS